MDNKKIALLGQPNSGKSTVFNSLTGMHQHVGNWPGKTVEKKEGTFTHNDVTYQVADLPGSYSLSANSDEEIVTRDYIAKNDLDLVCLLADASQLERSMYMLADYAGIGTPVMLVLTMMDVAESKGKRIDTKKLADKLGIEVCSIIAYDKKSYDSFFEKLEKAIKSGKTLNADALYDIVRQGEGAKEFEKYMEIVSVI
ncbi:MAG: 50S ribosome-binding GTPase, partial [Lachnospiraceae bacterium]|nr:50S ribosome-binding GTPase [Lachnospiraceae bacterium]